MYSVTRKASRRNTRAVRARTGPPSPLSMISSTLGWRSREITSASWRKRARKPSSRAWPGEMILTATLRWREESSAVDHGAAAAQHRPELKGADSPAHRLALPHTADRSVAGRRPAGCRPGPRPRLPPALKINENSACAGRLVSGAEVCYPLFPSTGRPGRRCAPTSAPRPAGSPDTRGLRPREPSRRPRVWKWGRLRADKECRTGAPAGKSPGR